jgi:hypothetical protein
MDLSEDDLRGMIREAIARQRGTGRIDGASPLHSTLDVTLHQHPSHGLLPLVPAGGGECMIEPSVRCNHCGYCKSLGH